MINSLVKFLAFILYCLFTIPAKGQYEINSSVWMDEYTVQHHIDNYLSNSLFSFEYYQKWNNERKQFESALSSRLTYTPFASNEIKVDATELDYTQRSFLLKWENFEVEKIDSLMKSSRMIYSTLIMYDTLGRITRSTYRNYKYKPIGEQIDFRIVYNHSDSLSGFTAEVIRSEGLLLNKKSNNTVQYFYDNHQRLLRVSAQYQNKRESSKFENSYSYDTLGRLISFLRVPSSDVYLDRRYSYTVTPFVLDSVQDDYSLLKIPSIQHWLKSYLDSNLNIIAYQKFERNRNAMVEYSYLTDQKQNRLLMLRPYPSYYGEDKEDNSVTRSCCSISRSQNLNDTIPYDTNYEPRYIGTFHSQCSIEERYTTPTGLVNAGSVEGYKRSEHQLDDGWKRVTYQRGSSAPSRFAPGYPVSVRFDVQYDKHLILDSKGVVRYIIDYDKLIKIEMVRK
ncbi:MAG: hypothetical protein C7M88_09090 [Candidatus Arcticimaribacter sp.]|nr:MAG: hypothetical protein C7M88_09090 [Candidatus Arcticimaribacter sp.]